VKEDVQVMVEEIEERSELIKSYEDSLVESVLQSKALEDKLYRAKLMKLDWEAIITDNQLKIEKVISEGLALRKRIEERVI